MEQGVFRDPSVENLLATGDQLGTYDWVNKKSGHCKNRGDRGFTYSMGWSCSFRFFFLVTFLYLQFRRLMARMTRFEKGSISWEYGNNNNFHLRISFSPQNSHKLGW